MATALSSLRSEVRLELGNPPTTVISDALIDARINKSYREAASRYRHPEAVTSRSVSTVASTQTIALPDPYWYTVAIRDESNDRPLIHKPLNWIVAQDTDSEGQPEYYTRLGSNLILYPTPVAVYTLTHYYTTPPTELSADGDETIFDLPDWDEIVIWGAVWRCFQTLGQQDRMIHARNIWRTLVHNMPETASMEAENEVDIAGPYKDKPYASR